LLGVRDHPNSSGPSLSDVRFAAIAGARDIRGKTTRGPGLRLAADSHVVEPSARPYLIADQRQIRGPWRRCRRLVRHQHRHGHVVEQLAAEAAEQGLAKVRMVVGAGDDQIGVEIDGA
jgi:hypothetical protein